ncbi:hypothetical protein ACE6H2_020098 [Prunus campanulata]
MKKRDAEEIKLQRVEVSGLRKQRSTVIQDLGYVDCSPIVPYKTKSNVVQPTKYLKPHKVKIVEQEAVNDVEDFSEPEAPKKGNGTRSSKGKTMALQQAPKKGKATKSSKGKAVAQPEAPKREKATRYSKGKGVATTSATEREDSVASLVFLKEITNHAPIEDIFWPLEDEEINEGEGGVVNEGGGGNVQNENGVHNSDNLAGGD